MSTMPIRPPKIACAPDCETGTAFATRTTTFGIQERVVRTPFGEAEPDISRAITDPTTGFTTLVEIFDSVPLDSLTIEFRGLLAGAVAPPLNYDSTDKEGSEVAA